MAPLVFRTTIDVCFVKAVLDGSDKKTRSTFRFQFSYIARAVRREILVRHER